MFAEAVERTKGFLVVVVVMIAACPSAGGRAVITWDGINTFANTTLTIRETGNASRTYREGGGFVRHGSTELTADQIKTLVDLVKSLELCKIPMESGYEPEKDEQTVTLVVNSPEVTCKVTLWEHQWRKIPAWYEAITAIDKRAQ